MSAPPPIRRDAARFRPHFTLSLLYTAAFFLVYALAMVAPTLLETWRALPPAQQADTELAARVAQRAIGPRVWLAVGAAVATVALGSAAGVLPGLRRR